MRAGFAAVSAVAIVALAAPAFAVDVKTAVSAHQVALGDTFVVQLTAMGDGSGRTDVTGQSLPLPPGMTTSAPSISQNTQMSIANGQMTRSVGVVATWTVAANKLGSFVVGPPSITMGGERAQGNSIAIQVLPAGGAPSRRQQRNAFDPFNFMDPFGTGSPFPPGFNFKSPFDDDQDQQAPSYPDELRMDKAPDPIAFLRAAVTPDHVVVGQQVTLRVYAYGARGTFQPENTNEPKHADFLAFDLKPEENRFYAVPIGDARYYGIKLYEQPLFPLHAGTLRAGDMSMGFAGRNYPHPAPGQTLRRESNWVDVVVTEPPLKDRPAGYRIGDVGEYKLEATVEPRDISAGESIGVVAKLSGIGNVPFKIQTPEQTGVEWQEPALSEKLEAPHGVVQGRRTFTYVVKLNEAGDVDLGDVTLPYWDLKRQRYVTARASLGRVHVKPNPNAKAIPPAEQKIDRLAGALKARDSLSSFAGPAKSLSDRPGFFGWLLLAPFGVVLAGGAVSASSKLREKMRARGTSLSAQLDAALREAKAAAGKDASQTVAALERAVFLGIEQKMGFKARAVLKTELARTLNERGLPEERARALAAILQDCDALRFTGAASGVDPDELVKRTQSTLLALRGDTLSVES